MPEATQLALEAVLGFLQDQHENIEDLIQLYHGKNSHGMYDELCSCLRHLLSGTATVKERKALMDVMDLVDSSWRMWTEHCESIVPENATERAEFFYSQMQQLYRELAHIN